MVFNEHINATTLDESDIDVTSGTVQNPALRATIQRNYGYHR